MQAAQGKSVHEVLAQSSKKSADQKKIEEKYGLDEEAAEPSDETSEKNDAEYEEKKQQ